MPNEVFFLPAATLPIISVPIQDVQLLDYAVVNKTVNAGYGQTACNSDTYMGLYDKDPYTSDQQRERDQYKLNDKDWNEVVFEEVDGTSSMKLALHSDWIKKQNYSINAIVDLHLPEQGIEGAFRITTIKHILPQKKPVDEDPDDDYEYKPITGLITHQSGTVFDITFAEDKGGAVGKRDTIGVTAVHPFYSLTAGDWVAVGDLKEGEKVLAKSGAAIVISSRKREGIETVYNLEVKDWHNFLVGEGLVVHNGYKLFKKVLERFKKKLLKGAEFIEDGTGLYKKVHGHHPISKGLFRDMFGSDSDFKKWCDNIYSISSNKLNEIVGKVGVHTKITGRQNNLYSQWRKAHPGKTMSLRNVIDIEIQAMTDSGVPLSKAKGTYLQIFGIYARNFI